MKVKISAGFTLIELMIVVAIVGIIAVIAVPSYQKQISGSRRNDAKQSLLLLQLRQEAYRLENDQYANTATLGMPASDYYTFTVEDDGVTTYTLKATAKGSQMSDALCSPLTLDQSMNKAPAGCW
ncbi:type IV pilin protein [Lacimicrobium alkaliphilum]|uniref:Type IV minor pilin protein PilE n=1 Tax=Lacimicrobium alkaliphilum TaxID=1526571 RepID=A0ABQ1RD15_9ALTE|nr:type IV pilin protein [Lacimicrobium alkaliphilum]GGD66437.1 type IV minor pilin protein PilE [Lacimicrobium alkaliphilum]